MLMAFNSGGFLKSANLDLVNMLLTTWPFLSGWVTRFSPKAIREVAVNHLQTQRWEQGLSDLQHPVSSDSLIPMFEGMVERAFSRSSNLEVSDDRVPPARPCWPT